MLKEKNKMTIDEIKEVRMKAKLSQERFAKKLGITFQTMNRWENGHAKPSKMAIILLQNFMKENNINLKSKKGK